MVKYIENLTISSQIQEIIKNSENFLYILTPYLKIPEILRQDLAVADKKGVKIRFLIKTNSSIKPDDAKLFYNNQNTKLYHIKNLHAKCYINEKSGIITSLNLYEFSQANNIEMGILFSNLDDSELYKKIITSVIDIGNKSLPITPEVLSKNLSAHPNRDVDTVDNRPQHGFLRSIWYSIRGGAFCIRCGAPIDFNLNNPLCGTCYPIWEKFKNPNYIEKYCHSCGEQFHSTFHRPLCNDCYLNMKEN